MFLWWQRIHFGTKLFTPEVEVGLPWSTVHNIHKPAMGRGNNKRAWQGGDKRRYHDAGDQEKNAGPPPEAFTRAYEAQLTDGDDMASELIRWAGDGPELWLDR